MMVLENHYFKVDMKRIKLLLTKSLSIFDKSSDMNFLIKRNAEVKKSVQF